MAYIYVSNLLIHTRCAIWAVEYTAFPLKCCVTTYDFIILCIKSKTQSMKIYTHYVCAMRCDAICARCIFHFALVHFCSRAHHRYIHPSISVVVGVRVVVVVGAVFALFPDSIWDFMYTYVRYINTYFVHVYNVHVCNVYGMCMLYGSRFFIRLTEMCVYIKWKRMSVCFNV